jgi:hypothetical protein
VNLVNDFANKVGDCFIAVGVTDITGTLNFNLLEIKGKQKWLMN